MGRIDSKEWRENALQMFEDGKATCDILDDDEIFDAIKGYHALTTANRELRALLGKSEQMLRRVTEVQVDDKFPLAIAADIAATLKPHEKGGE